MKISYIFSLLAGVVMASNVCAQELSTDSNTLVGSNEFAAANQLATDFSWIRDTHTGDFNKLMNPPEFMGERINSQDEQTCFTLKYDGALGVNFEDDDAEQIDSYYFVGTEELAVEDSTNGLMPLTADPYYSSVNDFLYARIDLIETNTDSAADVIKSSPGQELRIGCFNNEAEAVSARTVLNQSLFDAHLLRLENHITRNIVRLIR